MTKPSDPVNPNPDSVKPTLDTDKKKLDLTSMVPKPDPAVFSLLGAAEAGIKAARAALEGEVPNQPKALLQVTTVKAAMVSVEGLLQNQVIDSLVQIGSLALADKVLQAIEIKDGANKSSVEDNGKEEKASGYL